MNMRELRILAYYKNKGIWNKEYKSEAELLSDATEMLNMLPGTKVIRMDAIRAGGISDLLICYQGKFIAIELKDNVGTTSPQQVKFIQEVQNAGGTGKVCRSLEEVYVALKAAADG